VATLNAPITGGAGSINSQELESSTVDINTEFSNLITTQNAYSAAARIVTTADQMLQTLDQIPTQ
jgi:flagellar hook protein FlgE